MSTSGVVSRAQATNLSDAASAAQRPVIATWGVCAPDAHTATHDIHMARGAMAASSVGLVDSSKGMLTALIGGLKAYPQLRDSEPERHPEAGKNPDFSSKNRINDDSGVGQPDVFLPRVMHPPVESGNGLRPCPANNSGTLPIKRHVALEYCMERAAGTVVCMPSNHGWRTLFTHINRCCTCVYFKFVLPCVCRLSQHATGTQSDTTDERTRSFVWDLVLRSLNAWVAISRGIHHDAFGTWSLMYRLAFPNGVITYREAQN